MSITQKQENFCLAYIKCGNASQAYRESYNAEKMKSETITNNAYKLLEGNDIATRVQELRDKAAKGAIMTLEQRKELLTKIAQNVTYDKDGNAGFNDATKAVDLLNKMDGVYIQKQQTEHSGSLGVKFEIDLG